MECGCCNTCNAYDDKNEWKKAFERNQNDAVKSNIENGCYLCNNQYYNLCNKALYQRSFFNGMDIPPCNSDCQVNLEYKLRHGVKS
tara:strand:+ start:146 stop:403 length:258 start_codon:yes stop_codon:yes gene_type:complete